MKKIIIVGAGVLQMPAIIKAKELGLHVTAFDMDPEAPGFAFADHSKVISTIDVERLVDESVKIGADAVMTIASDMPMRSVSAIAQKTGLISVSEEVALKTTNKLMMRECLAKHNVPVPEFYRVRGLNEFLDIAKKFNGNFILKPVDNSGSRGVFLVQSNGCGKYLKEAFNYSMKFSRVSELIAETYIEGPEVSVETVSVNNEVYILAVTDKITTGSPDFVEMGHSQPSVLPEKEQKRIIEITKNAVKAIGIDNGPSHTEVILTEEGPLVVEIGARLGGDNITSSLVPLSTGIDMVKACIQIALGQKPDLKVKIKKGSAIRYFNAPAGEIKAVTGLDSAASTPDIKEVQFTRKIGDQITETRSSLDRAGFVIAQSENAESALAACKEALMKISVIAE